MKNLYLIIITYACVFFGCKPAHPLKNQVNNTRLIRFLRNRKDAINSISLKDSDSIKVYVKMKGKDQLVKIFNKKFPDDSIEYTYNVLQNKGKVIMVMVSPVSESGDWDVECDYYYDYNGQIFAFEKKANAFALPDDGVAYETTTDYFNNNFINIKHIYKLVDKNNKPLSKEYMFDRAGFDFKIYATVYDCLKAYNIKL
jgi:hypothetical protein